MELFIVLYKIFLTGIALFFTFYFSERIAAKYLPKDKSPFRIINVFVGILFILSIFLNSKYQLLFTILGIILFQYEMFYFLYRVYRLGIINKLNQVLVLSSLSVFTIVLYIPDFIHNLYFIYLACLLSIFVMILFFYIKMSHYKIYIFICFLSFLVLVSLGFYMVHEIYIPHITLILGTFYIGGLGSAIIFLKKSIKNNNGIASTKDYLSVYITEHDLLKLQFKADTEYKTMDEYLEQLIVGRLK